MFEAIISFMFLPFLSLAQPIASEPESIAVREFSLEKRYEDSFVNEVFKDNILLTLKYLSGEKIDPRKINFETIRKPFDYKIVLKPRETFAFHDDALPEFQGRIVKTTNAHFNAQ
ncbi:MAG: hypothetical protein AAB685_02695, partial [Patescibacteria group bacterium]